ncbi:MAG: amino acid ABC transporter substrate-binding protein [Selenomonadaceae bacterium]|nr:amino acid ABC transporter substrate-binding protein [Selenomonadaceae bacterium]
MRKIFCYAFLIINLALLFTGCIGEEKKAVEVEDAETPNQKLIIGLDDAYAPFGFRNDDNEIVGFDIDLAEEVAERMGVTVEFRPIDWDNKRAEITEGKIDIIWSGFNITPERKEYILFSKPYMLNRQIILVAKGANKGIVSAADLAGKVVGTQLGAPSDEYLAYDKTLKESFGKFITYDNYEHVFKALENGEVDAVICDELVVRYEMHRHLDKFEAIEATVGPITELAVGFRKDATELHDRFQKVFDEMIKDGTAEKISEKWFGADLIRTNK